MTERIKEESGKIIEKKERIIQAAINEFGRQGYINASTNAIAREAAVSKGLIFHYFQDKETLHYHCAKTAFDTLLGSADFRKVRAEKDIFKRLFVWAEEKRKLLMINANMNYLIVDLMNLPADMAPQAKALYREHYSEMTQLLVSDVDTAKFRTQGDPGEVTTYVLVCFEAMGNFMLRKYSHVTDWTTEAFDEAMAEFSTYVGYLKHGIYKKD